MAFWWENDEDQTVEHIYESAAAGITNEDLEPFGVTLNDFKYMFDVGWIQEDADPDQREAGRLGFFLYLEELGYDISDFDWDEWREWYDAA